MTRNHVLKPIVWIACLIPLALLVLESSREPWARTPSSASLTAPGWPPYSAAHRSCRSLPCGAGAGYSGSSSTAAWSVSSRFFTAACTCSPIFGWTRTSDIPAMAHDVVKRPFITMGTLAWILLLPLALTSTQKIDPRPRKELAASPSPGICCGGCRRHPLLLAGQARQAGAAALPCDSHRPARLAGRHLGWPKPRKSAETQKERKGRGRQLATDLPNSSYRPVRI